MFWYCFSLLVLPERLIEAIKESNYEQMLNALWITVYLFTVTAFALPLKTIKLFY